MPDELLERVAARVLESYPLTPPFERMFLGNAGGFSGSRLWKIRAGSQDYCLKAWPPERTPSVHLERIHRWMTAARQAGFSFVPTVFRTRDHASFVETERRLWDLTQWMPGTADFRLNPNRSRLVAAVRALAELHRVWSECETVRAMPPCIVRRLETAAEWLALVESGWRPDFAQPGLAPVADVARAAWSALPALVPPIQAALACWNHPQLLQPCLGDIWHDHVLFEGDRVCGIIDYGAMRLDHRAVDLARLLGSLAGDDPASCTAGLDAYRSVMPLAPAEIELVSILDRTGIVLAATNWLHWLYLERRQFENLAAVRSRMEMAVGRLTRWNSTGLSIILS